MLAFNIFIITAFFIGAGIGTGIAVATEEVESPVAVSEQQPVEVIENVVVNNEIPVDEPFQLPSVSDNGEIVPGQINGEIVQ